MEEAQDPLCPRPFRPFRRVSLDASRHPDLYRPPRIPTEHQGYRPPATFPASPPETGSSPTYTSQSPQTRCQLDRQRVAPPHSSSSGTYIELSQRSNSTGTYVNSNSSQTYVNPSHSSSNGTFIDSSPQQSISGRRFTDPSPQLSHPSNQYLSPSSQTNIYPGSRPSSKAAHHAPQGAVSGSPPLQHHGVLYTDSPPHGYGMSPQSPYPPTTPSYPASYGTTTTHLSQPSSRGSASKDLTAHHRQHLYHPAHNNATHPPPPLPAHAYPPPQPPQQPSPEHFPAVQTGLYRTYPVPKANVNAKHAHFPFPSDSDHSTSSGGVSVNSSISNPARHLPRRERRRAQRRGHAVYRGGYATDASTPSSANDDDDEAYSDEDTDYYDSGDESPKGHRHRHRHDHHNHRAKENGKREAANGGRKQQPDDHSYSGDEAERQVKEHRRREAKRKKYKRKLDELRSEQEHEYRMDRKYDSWPAMLDLAAFFATYILT